MKIDKYFHLYGRKNDVVFEEVEQPEPQWIPCSERLPSYGEDVLLSIGGYCNVGHLIQTNDEIQYNWYFSGWYHLVDDVDAWMPLPAPYQENADA